MKNLNPYASLIIEKMCEFIGKKPDDIDFDKVDWYNDYEWNQEKQDEFKHWMIGFLTGNLQARKAVMSYPHKSKTAIEKVTNEFISNYGWVVK